MDMDTPEDYERIRRFAAFSDEALPTVEDAYYFLSLLQTPREVRAHSQVVATVGEAVARALQPHAPKLDVDLVRVACLLHDMARTRPKHAVVGQNVLANLGLVRLGEVVGAHMALPAGPKDKPRDGPRISEKKLAPLTEEELVYLADKLVAEDEIVGLEGRRVRTLLKIEGNSSKAADKTQLVQNIDSRLEVARRIQEKVESLLGCPLQEVLPRVTQPST